MNKILNLECKAQIIFIDRQSKDFFNHLKTVSTYKGRHEQNYDINVLKNQILDQNRFNVGAVKIYIDDLLVRSLLLEKYKDWLLLSRLISHNFSTLPLLTVYGEKFIIQKAQDLNCKGIFSTINLSNKLYLSCIDTAKFKKFNNRNIPLYNKHLEVISTVKKLTHPIIFNYTKQYVLYKEFNQNNIMEIIQ